MDAFPVTVCGSVEHRTGFTLQTIDPDPERDLEVFDGQPERIRFTGDEPEESEDGE
jgi:hypothetical protein